MLLFVASWASALFALVIGKTLKMHPDVLTRLEGSEPAQLFEYLKNCLEEDDAICGSRWNPSRRRVFLEIVAKAVGFDPDRRLITRRVHPPRSCRVPPRRVGS